MTSFICVILPDEATAMAAAQALAALHAAGSITLFGRSRVLRNADGSLAIREPVANGAPLGVLVEALVGAAAVAAGATTAASHRHLVEALGELSGIGLGADVVEECLAALAPGCAAILAEVGEHWLAPAEAAMDGLGGLVIRRQRAGVAQDRLYREIAALEGELQALEMEAERVSCEARRAIRRRADATRKRLAAAARMAAAMLVRLEAETAARLEALEGQLEQAGTELALRVETEARIGQALACAQAEAEQRAATLRAAQAMARAALGTDAED